MRKLFLMDAESTTNDDRDHILEIMTEAGS